MRTDSHLYALFRECPQLIFELAGLPPAGPCRMEQVTVKAISRTMDGLLTPADPAAPLSIVEFQFQREENIYTRTVIEMASLQQQHGQRGVQGLIFFLTRRLDPRTPPWTHSVRAIYLDSVLKGAQQGRGALLRNQIAAKFGQPAAALADRLEKLPTADLDALAVALLGMKKVAELRAWLTGKC